MQNAICDRCGFKYRMDQLKLEWTGLMVCSGPDTHSCWDPRHPQEFVRAVPEKLPIETRTVGTLTFLTTNEVAADDL